MPRLPRYCEAIRRYTDEAEAYLETKYGKRRYKQVRNRLLRPLINTIMTGRLPSSKRKLPPVRRLATMLRKLEQQILKDGYRLPKAWYETRIYGTSRRTAAFRWHVNPLELKYLEQLWSDLQWHREEYRNLIAHLQPEWTFDVDEIHEDIVVWLDDKAIEDIVLVSLEAYAVPRRGLRFTETYGICFGSTKSTEEKRQAHGKHTTRYVYASSVHIQLRAEGYSNKVTYDLRSLETQMAVGTHLFPQLDIVGDFHTHPYKDVDELKALKGWNFSPGDESGIPTWVEPLKKMGYHPRTSIVVGIAKGGKRIIRPGRLKPNVVRFSINKYHFYIACFRIIGNRYSDKRITLSSIALPGM
jgi:hypothetical protein